MEIKEVRDYIFGSFEDHIIDVEEAYLRNLDVFARWESGTPAPLDQTFYSLLVP